MYIYISLQILLSLLDDVRILISTDPGGPRTYGFYGFGSTTLYLGVLKVAKQPQKRLKGLNIPKLKFLNLLGSHFRFSPKMGMQLFCRRD
jgi:hypothetical protein